MQQLTLNPFEFILEIKLGSVNTQLKYSVVEWTVDNSNGTSSESLEIFIGTHYEYTKKAYPGEIYFTLGEYKKPVNLES